MKVLCLIDNLIPPGHRWLWKYLPENDDELIFWSRRSSRPVPEMGKLLNYYPAYLRAGFRPRNAATQYDVVAWEGKNGFPYALFRQHRRPEITPLAAAFNIRGEPLSGPSALRAEVRLA